MMMMADTLTNNVRLENSASSKVKPIAEIELQDTITSTAIDIIDPPPPPANENPQDAWLPITESRNGNTFTATCHLLCSGIGVQLLFLPMGFISLGWSWGIVWLTVAYSWQLYTIWLLVNLHESSVTVPDPQINNNNNGNIRYSRFLHLAMVAFGEKLGKLLAMFPTLYLSGGTCVMYIITGASTMERLYQLVNCENHVGCNAKAFMTAAEWFLVFICLAIFIALFFPNLNSLAPVTLIGSITALVYSTLLWLLSLTNSNRPVSAGAQTTVDAGGIRDVLNGIGFIALSFRGHNLVLEIQGTIPTNPKQPSRKPMWRGVIISYLVIAVCMYPLAIVGYWAYGNTKMNGGILTSFTEINQNKTSKYIIGTIHLIILINYLCAFQIFAMPTFDNFERLYTSKKNKPCPRWVRATIKVFIGGLTYFISVAVPFLPNLGALTGSIALPLTLVYPCFMWLMIKKPRRFSKMWCLNLVLGSLGTMLSVLLATAAMWSLIADGLHANFFNPR
ncbi:hypothetical protein RD792_002222 [Penstemon davidsonii]|uniref:Amino acid transporter transmembrane domain-containing protein n=1 Tax=Penstemon davidsonii TaxID=160366 RepID=A0ABR0DQF8_9LAMI|nr:hypothetical protein RD792_002222 [Penstemon davidsonii]